ncbi:MAG: VWA domain-containing protein [Oscillospiraceae bacterium]|nr:VWA domain-containing protein [Oscillospiraceae bacterium]
MQDNQMTELVFILDRSGSMNGLEKDTIGGFNSMIEKQKKETGKAFVTTILFDDKLEKLHDRLNLEQVQPLTDKDYFVRGSTALLDAIGTTIHHISNTYKFMRSEDIPSKTMFIITTDGMENSSREFNYPKIKSMIEEKQKLGWEFIFIGANIDAVTEGAKFGISAERAVNYHADKIGTGNLFEAVSASVSEMRISRKVSNAWRKNIDKDYNNRK